MASHASHPHAPWTALQAGWRQAGRFVRRHVRAALFSLGALSAVTGASVEVLIASPPMAATAADDALPLIGQATVAALGR